MTERTRKGYASDAEYFTAWKRSKGIAMTDYIFVDYLKFLEMEAVHFRTGKPLSVATIARRYAGALWFVKKNHPTLYADMVWPIRPRIKRAEHLPNPLTLEEHKRYLANTTKHDLRVLHKVQIENKTTKEVAKELGVKGEGVVSSSIGRVFIAANIKGHKPIDLRDFPVITSEELIALEDEYGGKAPHSRK